MKKLLLILVSCFLFLNSSFAQSGIQWQKCLGGWDIDQAYSVHQTTDGGYIVAGFSNSNNGDVSGWHGNDDYWVVKLDNGGNIQWKKCLGGPYIEDARSVQQTADGGYIVAGQTLSNSGDVSGIHNQQDYWIVKLDSSGSIQWQKCLGGNDSDYGTAVQPTADGGYIVAGYTASNDGDVTGFHGVAPYWDYWIVKLDGSGNIQWQKCLGGTSNDVALSVQQTTDGGYIVAGYTISNDGDVTGWHGNTDYWVVKLNSSGNIQWQKCLGGTYSDYAFSVKQSADGGYIVGGYTISVDGDVTGNHGFDDYWIVKLDGSGNLQWQKCLGGTNFDRAYSVQQTIDGGYIVAGYTQSNDGDVSGNHADEDYWVVKLDSSGNFQWQKCLGGTGKEEAKSVEQTTDGGYIVAGWTASNDGDVTGLHVNGTTSDYWIVKLSPTVGIEEETNISFVNLSPNPATTSFTINPKYPGGFTISEIEIYNALGENVYKSQVSNLKSLISVDVSQLLPGVYFVAVTDDKGNKITRRFIKL